MFEHIVLLRFKEDTSQRSIDSVMSALRFVYTQVPGITEATTGTNVTARAHGYTHGATSRFTDKAALDAFYPHPPHQEWIETWLKPVPADLLVMDYEVL